MIGTAVICGNRLYHGDCIEVLKSLDLQVGEGKRIHIITDPPYEKHMHSAKSGGRGFRTDGRAELEAVNFESIDAIRPLVTPLMVAAATGWLLAFCTPEGVAPWRDAIEAAGAKYKRACAWIKPDSAPQFNGQCPAMAVEMFVSAWCGPGFASWNGGGRRNYFIHPTNNKSREGTHSTEKPISLMSEIITLFTNEGDLVIDPFMGSGTTGISCMLLGRQFIGIEQKQEYYELAAKRIDTHSRDLLLVRKPQEPSNLDLFA